MSSRSSGPMNEFYNLLNRLLQSFYPKDPYGFFYEPVDVQLVPDYLTIIKKPMDFGTMKQKIDSKEYSSLRDFQCDFELICSNCMIYNAPNTVYYKTAQKLLHFGRKVIAKEAPKANALLILAAAEGSDGQKQALDTFQETKDVPDYSSGNLNQLKRKAEIALIKKLHDGSALFSSLKKYRGPIPLSVNEDSSLDLSEYPELESVYISPVHESMTDTRSDLWRLGHTANIVSSYLTRSQNAKLSSTNAPFNAATASGYPYTYYSLGVDPGKPFYSFCPFYDSQGYPIPPFDTPGLSLAYGDPKGRAYVESLEHFIGEHDTTSLLSELTANGHDYVQTIYAWRQQMKKQQEVIASKPNSPTDTRASTPTIDAETSRSMKSLEHLESPHTDRENESLPLLEQIKSDLNLLAKMLRWKKVEPEIEKLDRMPLLQFIKQFHQQLSSSVYTTSESNKKELTTNLPSFADTDAKLIHISKNLLRLQSFQNKRFKLGKPSVVTQEERDIVLELKEIIIELAEQVLPIDLASTLTGDSQIQNPSLPIHAAMGTLKEARPMPLFSGTLEKQT